MANAMDITIEKLIYGGDGLAHHDGQTVFIPFVMPAERVSAGPVERKKKFVRARVERVIEPSPGRVVPRCGYFGECGGCHYQHIPAAAQLSYKVEILRETLRRIGGIEWNQAIAAHASPPWGYRNRAQWKIRAMENLQAGPPGEASAAKLGIGYFRANSTALCAVDDCAILSPLLLKTLLALRDLLDMGALPRELREVEAFCSEENAESAAGLLLTAVFAGFPSRVRELAEKIRSVAPEATSLLFQNSSGERMELFGPGFLDYEVCGVNYRVGHLSFFQVNRFLANDLAREVAANEADGQLALDLFAGVGLFSALLAKRFERVVAVESNPAAVRDLEANSLRGRAQSGGSVEVRADEAERFLHKCKERPDLVVLDPPRAGLAPGVIEKLAKLAPARITYVSCEPPTLARDLKALCASGYSIASVHLFDLFPQTFHMEAVVRLHRHS